MKISFQTILLVIFGLFIVFGVAVFAGYIDIGSSSKEKEITGYAVMWGTLDSQLVDSYMQANSIGGKTISITYIQKNPNSYENELVSAFASGKGPDMFMVTPEIFWRQRDKMLELPYASYPAAIYTSAYMDIAKMYLSPTGVLAYPLYIDPLVGYWNKDIFASAGFAVPPQEWKEFPDLAKKLSQVTENFTIERNAFALGEFSNIVHAKDILSLLFLQAGDPVTHIDKNGKLELDLGQINSNTDSMSGAAVALDFYSQFADPSKRSTYTWNKSFGSDAGQFLSSDLAYYFGLGSELSVLRRSNPNLNFDMTFVPQANKNGIKTTYGRLYGLAISKQSKNIPLAYAVMNNMFAPEHANAFISSMQKSGISIAPVRRDMMTSDPSSPYGAALYQSALVAKTWIDPNASFTSDAWRSMVSDVQSGKSTAQGAISTVRIKMNAYLKIE